MNRLAEISILDIAQKPISLEQLSEKKLLIVNTASECGYTPQYAQLEELYREMKGLVNILACPSNDFGAQEPGDNHEIAQFCETKFNITFPITEKISVTGANVHPLFHWFSDIALNDSKSAVPQWNFHKFLIEPGGKFYKDLPSSVSPLDEEIVNWIMSPS
jgi:glutathione peroxidase